MAGALVGTGGTWAGDCDLAHDSRRVRGGAGWKAEDRFYSVVVWGEGNFSEAGSCEQLDEESRTMMRKKPDRDT